MWLYVSGISYKKNEKKTAFYQPPGLLSDYPTSQIHFKLEEKNYDFQRKKMFCFVYCYFHTEIRFFISFKKIKLTHEPRWTETIFCHSILICKNI